MLIMPSLNWGESNNPLSRSEPRQLWKAESCIYTQARGLNSSTLPWFG